MPLIAAADSLNEPLALLGVALIGGALLAGLAHRSFLSLTALFVLGSGIPEGETIFNLAALVVFCSIVLHGLTDHPGAEWMARHAERMDAGRAGAA